MITDKQGNELQWVTSIEVLPETGGGWKIVCHWNTGQSRTAHHARYKRTAYTWARGMAAGLGSRPAKYGRIELIVKDKKGVIHVKSTIGGEFHS